MYIDIDRKMKTLCELICCACCVCVREIDRQADKQTETSRQTDTERL